MSYVVIISLVFAVMTVTFLARTLRCVRRGRFVRAGGCCAGGVLSAAVAAAGIVLLFSYMSYERLTAETRVASLEFRRISPEEHQARLMLPGEQDRFFILRGDEWQIDARIVTWRPPATILGLEPIYQLERLSGRYAEIDRERSETRTVHALAPRRAMDLWSIARRFPALMPGIDAHYGTATYVPMADGARYDVNLTRDALITRPANEAASVAVGNWDTDGN